MARYTKGGNVSTVPEINSELEKIETSIADMLSRKSDTPNEMLSTLDMNSNRITNLPVPVNGSDAARFVDVGGGVFTVLTDEALVFDNILEMTTADLVAGQYVRCKRYYSGGSLVGGLEFNVVAGGTGVADGGSFHDNVNGTQAELIIESEVSVKKFGASPSLSALSNTTRSQLAIDYAIANNANVVFDGGEYQLNKLLVDGATNLTISGKSATLALEFIDYGSDTQIIRVRNSANTVIENLSFKGTSNSSSTYDSVNRYSAIDVSTSSFTTIKGCEFYNFSSYGIFAQGLTGGTYTEGMIISNNVFRDFPLDPTTSNQAGVILSADGEYSTIINNRFFRIPSAARFDDGANSMFKNNIVMQLNGQVSTGSGAIFARGNSNYGKLQIIGNKFNHIETGQRIINIQGDPLKPQNPMIINDNEFLVSGSALGAFLILFDAVENSTICNNIFRPAAVVTGQATIRLNNGSDNCLIADNYILGGDIGIAISASVGAKLRDNNLEGQTTAKVTGGTGSIINVSNRAFSFIVNAVGALQVPSDDTGVSCSKIATGHYQLAHSFGTTAYSVAVEIDNSALAVERSTSVVRGTATTDIYINDTAGAPVDDDFMLTITHSVSSQYLL